MNAITIAEAPKIDTNAIDHANLAESTKAKYRRELERLARAGVNPLDHRALIAYADTLKDSSRAFLKAALKLTTEGLEQDIKARATPGNVAQAQAAIMRLEAMRGAVQVRERKGSKAHTWLTQAQVQEITRACGGGLEGKRDWIVLGLLLGAGLRREELAMLTFDALKQQGDRAVLEITGKGGKRRVVPIQKILADRLKEWQKITGGGRIARALGRAGKLEARMSSVSIFHLVRKYGRLIGRPNLAPHDCRRTYAQLGYAAGVPVTQISVLLGHADLKTTQRYLDLHLDLQTTVSDFIPLSST